MPHHQEFTVVLDEFFAVVGAGLPVKLLDGNGFFAVKNLDGGRLAATRVPGVEADSKGRITDALLRRIGQVWQVVADAHAQAIRRPARAPAHEQPEADFELVKRRTI